MRAAQQTASTVQGAGGGIIENRAVPVYIIGSAFPQSDKHGPAEIEIAKLRAQFAEISYRVETGIATIHNARRAGRASLSAHGRAHWQGVAIDEGNRLSDLLQIRHAPTIEPTTGPGRTVPPSDACIRRALKRHQEFIAAKIEAIEAEAAMFAAWRQPCGTVTWQAWESHWRAMSRALATANKLRGAE